eukprot:CAMPEP_0115717642 /NCGR_PEP_ID=MMETSP0272-20121206/76985_1 /TAXON_ID=71861 /ORGANISM="Scrippsiella trochoidea, Strain CCMP3099" /LENGTH=68 /DNA_ID=CAMNT_0003160075 /DNA_START=257 /DNA_END=460 /DNA_ORIENTATION=-
MTRHRDDQHWLPAYTVHQDTQEWCSYAVRDRIGAAQDADEGDAFVELLDHLGHQRVKEAPLKEVNEHD